MSEVKTVFQDRTFDLEQTAELSGDWQKLQGLFTAGEITAPSSDPTMADLIISLWQRSLNQAANSEELKKVKRCRAAALWEAVDVDINRLTESSARAAVDNGLSHELNNASTAPTGFVYLAGGSDDFRKAFLIFGIKPSERLEAKPLENREVSDACVSAKDEAAVWVNILRKRISDFLSKVTVVTPKKNLFWQWREFVEQKLQESGFPDENAQDIRMGIETIDTILQNLANLANEGTVPPIIHHAGENKFLFDFTVLPKDMIASSILPIF